jgi:hypothetical protein
MKRVLLALILAWPAMLPAAEPALATKPATPAAPASDLTRDLGRGLFYQRAHSLPADLPAAETRKRPLVLDLRYTQGDADAATALIGWLKFYATPHAPVFVLANGQTAEPVRRALSTRGTLPNVLVVGAPGKGFVPDIAIQTTADNERSAYDALANGTDANALIVENPDKARNDEASLSRDRSTESDAAKEQAPAIPLDAALQRAVHLHRALVALKKI